MVARYPRRLKSSSTIYGSKFLEIFSEFFPKFFPKISILAIEPKGTLSCKWIIYIAKNYTFWQEICRSGFAAGTFVVSDLPFAASADGNSVSIKGMHFYLKEKNATAFKLNVV